ncbi:zinc finger BED domain-containing protein DAYSLEEPER-like [Tasmannia lanceolata]|uniref:zinc finger BED domain-containing protein DAYSLEEPER-like n=1 Tax=Tasmannia lanceolata TaxID=3420 RepID=UPI004063EDAA
MANMMRDKFDKYWGDCSLLMAITAVLDPRNKMILIRFTFPEIYSKSEAQTNIRLVEDALHELFNDYVAIYTLSNAEKVSQVASIGGTSSSVVGTLKHKNKRDIHNEGNKDSSYKFDTIEWWKVNHLKFRILSKMAVDILSIPITTVASESSFSTGGRVQETCSAQKLSSFLPSADTAKKFKSLSFSELCSVSYYPQEPLILYFSEGWENFD